MFFKDVFRLIKSSFNRFLAIAGIVFIGVSFMMGLLSSSDIMRESMEVYNNDTNLHDIQIYSTFGFDDKDVKAIKELDDVDEIFVSKTRDVYANIEGTNDNLVTRVREIDSNLDKFVLVDGRLPEKENECLYMAASAQGDYSAESQIGKKVNLSLEKEELSESLKNLKYTIVGEVTMSDSYTKVAFPSLLDNKDLTMYILVPNSNFISEYYSSIALTLNGARDYNSFLKGYKSFVAEKIEPIKDLANQRQSLLKNRIVDEANKEIKDAKEELEKAQNEGRQKLDDAKKELENAKKQIDDGEREIIRNEKTIKDSQAQINSGESELASKESELNSAIASAEASGGMSLDALITSTRSNMDAYNTALSTRAELESQRAQLVSTKNTADALLARYGYTIGPETRGQIEEAMAQIEDKNSQEYRNLQTALQLLDTYESYDETLAQIDDGIAQCNDGIAQIENGYAATGGIENTYNNLLTLKDARDQISSARSQLEQAKRDVENGKSQLAKAKNDLEKGKKEYQDGLKEYEDGEKEYNKKISDAKDQIEDAENKLKDLGEGRWEVLDRESHSSSYLYKNSCDQMQSIGTILPLIFFLVAALVCSTTMKRLIDEKRSEIGVYCALGYSNKSIIGRYLCYVLFATLISSVIGIAFGMWLFPTVIYNTWKILYVSPDMVMLLPIDNLIISVLSFSALMCAVSYFVIRTTLKEVPSQLMRPKAPKNAKEILLEKFKGLWNRLSFTSKITARNIFRYKSRFFMTVIGIAGCTGLLLLGFGVKDSISEIVDVQFGQLFNYTHSINLSNDRHIKEIEKEVNADENNEMCVEMAQYSIKAGKDEDSKEVLNMYVSSKENANKIYALYNYKNDKPMELSDEGIIITEKFSINNDISIGDEIIIESLDGVEAKTKVVGISKMYFSHYGFISDTLYKELFKEDVNYNALAIANHNDSTKLLSLVDEYNDISSITDFSSQSERFELMIKALDIIILVVIIVAGALAFVVLINLTNVNISERIREIATLKVLGFRNNEVDTYIFKEILLLTLIGAVFGLPLGVIETKFVMSVINMDFVIFPTDVKPLSYVYAFGITMIFTIIVFFLTRKTLRKVDMIESLKSVE